MLKIFDAKKKSKLQYFEVSTNPFDEGKSIGGLGTSDQYNEKKELDRRLKQEVEDVKRELRKVLLL